LQPSTASSAPAHAPLRPHSFACTDSLCRTNRRCGCWRWCGTIRQRGGCQDPLPHWLCGALLCKSTSLSASYVRADIASDAGKFRGACNAPEHARNRSQTNAATSMPHVRPERRTIAAVHTRPATLTPQVPGSSPGREPEVARPLVGVAILGLGLALACTPQHRGRVDPPEPSFGLDVADFGETSEQVSALPVVVDNALRSATQRRPQNVTRRDQHVIHAAFSAFPQT